MPGWIRNLIRKTSAQGVAAPSAAPRVDWLAQGNAALARGDTAAAADCYRHAAAADPASAPALLNLGYAQLELGEAGAAALSLRAALARDSSSADAHYLLGMALAQVAEVDQALDALRQAVRLKPDFEHAWRELCGLLVQSGRAGEALLELDAALTAHPQDVALLQWRGQVLSDAGRLEEALATARRLVSLHPQQAHAWSNTGMLLYRLERFDEALQACAHAVSLPAAAPEHFYNLGCCHLALNDCEGVLRAARSGLALAPEDADLGWLRAVALLMTGDMRQGWQAYESRWHRRNGEVPRKLRVPEPEWDGSQPLAGQTLLVYAEQAFGDTLQFLRFVPALQALGARVVLRLQAAVAPLAPGIVGAAGMRVIAEDQPLPPFDLHCSLMSLPLLLGTELATLPGAPYLRADPGLRAEWEARLPPRTGPRLGLAWSGKPIPDPRRSIPLQPLLDRIPGGVQIISLQKEVKEADRAALAARTGMFHAGEDLRNFADTAALADCVDLVLTIDTGVAHLAGALGKPMWVLLPHVPDWRWMLEREDSPWYPAARLFRQDASRAWEPVLQRVGAALDAFARSPASA